MADEDFEVGTKRQLVSRQIFFATAAVILAAGGFYLQRVNAFGIEAWFARTGALLVGFAIVANFVDASFGFFSGFSKNTLGGVFGEGISKSLFWIETTVAVSGTLIWAFGDLWPTSACGSTTC